jgi:hypothetical protein
MQASAMVPVACATTMTEALFSHQARRKDTRNSLAAPLLLLEQEHVQHWQDGLVD